jgi:X-X-X-Leu-X-X-Gly heptad repeat protein
MGSIDRGFGGMNPKPGINLRFVTIGMDDCYDEAVIPHGSLRKDTKIGSAIHHQISENHPELMKTLQAVIDEFVPDAIVAVNMFTSFLVSRLKFDCLFWADIGGWTMAKAQSEAFKTGSDKRLSHYLGIEERILDRADVISVVSDASKYAVLGELAMMKKMGVSEFGRDRVVTIENGLEDFETDLFDASVTIRKPPTIENAWSAGSFEKVSTVGAFGGGGGGFGGSGFGSASGRGGPNYFRGEGSFTGTDIPHNAFVILWLGSYSSWVDEETLFKAVEAAIKESEGEDGMGGEEAEGSHGSTRKLEQVRVSARHGAASKRRIYFVSTGGLSEEPNLASISGGGRAQLSFFPPLSRHEPANKTYLKFKELIGLSRFQDRFVFLGWVPAKHIPYLYNEADMGINVDRKCLQTLTDSRSRLIEMMKFRLPVVSTLGTELSWRVESVGAGIGVMSGDVLGLKNAIIELYKNPARRKDYGDRGRRFVEQYCSYGLVMRPFVEWMRGVKGSAALVSGDKILNGKGFDVNDGKIGNEGAGSIASATGGLAMPGGSREHKKIDAREIFDTAAKAASGAARVASGAAKAASGAAKVAAGAVKTISSVSGRFLRKLKK